MQVCFIQKCNTVKSEKKCKFCLVLSLFTCYIIEYTVYYPCHYTHLLFSQNWLSSLKPKGLRSKITDDPDAFIRGRPGNIERNYVPVGADTINSEHFQIFKPLKLTNWELSEVSKLYLPFTIKNIHNGNSTCLQLYTVEMKILRIKYVIMVSSYFYIPRSN